MKNIKKTIENISLWLKDYADKNGFKGYVLGLSGGIDSAVSLALAVKAVGNENVKCFALPCSTASERDRYEDIDDAALLVETFKVPFEVISLNGTLDVLYKQIVKHDKKENSLVIPNIKARLRMVTLRALAEANNCLVLGTTNKTEEYLGYFTKAGDGGVGVDIEPIADFFKYEVKELAKELGVPDEIIEKKPSAGLWYDQTDEDEIGFSYDEIDKYLTIREELTGKELNKYTKDIVCTKSYFVGENEYYDAYYVKAIDYMKEKSKKVKSLNISNDLIDRVEGMIYSANHKRYFPPYFEN